MPESPDLYVLDADDTMRPATLEEREAFARLVHTGLSRFWHTFPAAFNRACREESRRIRRAMRRFTRYT
jgi:FMN phosphatase YigB (HAD superfamily)